MKGRARSFRASLLLSSGLMHAGCGGGAPGLVSEVPAPASEAPAPASEVSGSEAAPASARAPGAPGEDKTRPSDQAGASAVLWCASAGAPLVGQPVLDAEERAYLVTADGYLHAFERDGRYRWSYTVKGTPLGSVSLRPTDGAILLGTTASMVYAITQIGSLYFAYGTLTPVWSGLFSLNEETVVFLGQDRRLYALGTSGAPRYRVRAPGEPMGGPVVAPGDVVWLPLTDGVARFESARKLEKIPHQAPVEEVVALGEGAVSRAGGKAYALLGVEPPRPLGSAEFLSGGQGEVAVTREDASLSFYEEDLRLTEEQAIAPPQLSAAPALGPSLIWYPTSGGMLVVVGRSRESGRGSEQGSRREISLGKGSLQTPVLGQSGTYALVPTLGGEFCAVSVAASVSTAVSVSSGAKRPS